jgi:hypothetical protein
MQKIQVKKKCGGGYIVQDNREVVSALNALYGIKRLDRRGHFAAPMSARIFSTCHPVQRLDILTPAGYFPDLTPAHQVLFPTGIIAGIGGSASGSPIIWCSRRNPVSGSWCIVSLLSN